jgi:hypothetical protein
VERLLERLSALLSAAGHLDQQMLFFQSELPIIGGAAAAFHLYAQRTALAQLQAAEADVPARQAPPLLPHDLAVDVTVRGEILLVPAKRPACLRRCFASAWQTPYLVLLWPAELDRGFGLAAPEGTACVH